MHSLRLVYAALFLVASMAVFELWSQIGGQSHLDLMPWYLKLVLGEGAAFAVVRVIAAAVAQDRVWNAQSLRWTGILLAFLVCCGLASFYYHTYEEEQDEPDESVTSSLPVQFNPNIAPIPCRGREGAVFPSFSTTSYT